jgi:transcriptional regulator with XRE-family HTH domain
LAERVGISPSHLSRFERGQRHVSLATLDAIVRALLELGADALPELTASGGLARPDSSRLRSREDRRPDGSD